MRRLTRIASTLAVGITWMIAWSTPGIAQGQAVPGGLQPPTSRSTWSQRVVRPASTSAQNRKVGWSSYRPGQFGQQVKTVSADQTPVFSQDPSILDSETVLQLGDGAAHDGCQACGPGEACGEVCADPCVDACGPVACGGYYQCGDLARAIGGLVGYVLASTNFSAGVQGFKGPTDMGRNGNFGFHYGLNRGSPLGDPWGIGYQFGVSVVQSNFSGDQIVDIFSSDNRDQVFFTSGIFRRAVCGGLQWGVVYDLVRDTYRDNATSGQIRGELSLVSQGCREIGFWGAFGVNGDRIQISLIDQVLDDLKVTPIDIYSIFYRRYFSGGGQGRVWAGLTDRGDAVLGADATVPLGTSWALENSFTYMIPEDGHSADGQQREGWNVALRLVWYPGRQAACEIQGPYAPLMMVADNGSMILDTRNK
jgi:hypothetical protein